MCTNKAVQLEVQLCGSKTHIRMAILSAPFVLLMALLSSIPCTRKAVEAVEPAQLSPPKRDHIVQHPSGALDAEELVEKLVARGWHTHAAEAVVQLNTEWFGILAQENPDGLQRQIALLQALGIQLRKHQHLASLVTQHPETAGLLAATKNPALVAESFKAARGNYSRLAGLYVRHATPEDVEALAQALKNNRDLIVRLSQRGLVGSEVLFIFERDGEATLTYERWLHDVLMGKLDSPSSTEDELASLVHLLLTYGPNLRQRMKQNEDFSVKFPELWRKLANVAERNQNMFELYLDDPRIWDLLALAEGKKLLQDWGLLPIDLLYGYPALHHDPYPVELHEEVIRVLHVGDETTIRALIEFRGEPLFRQLLNRRLKPEIRAAACQKLLEAGADAPRLLVRYAYLPDTALEREVGERPPSGLKTWIPLYYAVYEVPRKLLQGREPTTMEWFQALVDLASVGLPVLKGSGKPAVQTLRAIGKEVAERQMENMVVAQLTQEVLVKFSVTGVLSRMQPAFRAAVMKELATVEVTQPVQFMFRYSGVGRKTLQALTQLDAGLFIRGDAKVGIRCGTTSTMVHRFINDTALSFGLGMAIESAPGHEATRQLGKGAQSAQAWLEERWRQHVSAWWLMNAAHMLDADVRRPAP
jgi:hypothetical protein